MLVFIYWCILDFSMCLKIIIDILYKESTKYGLLTTITIKENGIYLNEKLVDKNIRIDDLKLGEGNCNTIKIGVKDNATHKGGLNIFGEKFGDFSQAIIFTARYK